MKIMEDLKGSKVPIFIIDKSLDKPNEVVLFPEKVEKAKVTIVKLGLPKKQLRGHTS